MPSDEAEPAISAETANAVASREQVARILESSHFAKAERLKRFLRFVTEETLKGLSTEMKETVIGIEVFDRDAATYDPRLDPIVRVQAGRVRAKLAAYYAQEGAEDGILVELPRGQYIPRFSLRSRAPSRLADTIAVLLFANDSADPTTAHFSDGLTEKLIRALARLPAIRVTTRRSRFRFTGADRELGEIGRLLGAGKIVKGSVSKADARLRVAVQLVNVTDGHQLWFEEYDRTLADWTALQEEIANAIRIVLSGLRGKGQLPSFAPPTQSVSAFSDHDVS